MEKRMYILLRILTEATGKHQRFYKMGGQFWQGGYTAAKESKHSGRRNSARLEIQQPGTRRIIIDLNIMKVVNYFNLIAV